MNMQRDTKEEPPSFEFPSATDVSSFAKAIGLDLIYDSQFKWLVEQALGSPLPEGCKPFINPDGRVFFVQGGNATWIHPLVEPYKQIYSQVTAEYVGGNGGRRGRLCFVRVMGSGGLTHSRTIPFITCRAKKRQAEEAKALLAEANEGSGLDGGDEVGYGNRREVWYCKGGQQSERGTRLDQCLSLLFTRFAARSISRAAADTLAHLLAQLRITCSPPQDEEDREFDNVVENSLEDALLYYKQAYGDPDVDDVEPKLDAPRYWDVQPEQVVGMCDLFGIDLEGGEASLVWVARQAAAVDLPPAWHSHEGDDTVAMLARESRGIVEEDGFVSFTCDRWGCITLKERARNSILEHPSTAYFEYVVQSLREELAETSVDDGDDGGESSTTEQTFRDPNDEGKFFKFDFATGELTELDDKECERLSERIEAEAAKRIGVVEEEEEEDEGEEGGGRNKGQRQEDQAGGDEEASTAPKIIKEEEEEEKEEEEKGDDDNDHEEDEDVAFLNELVPVQTVEIKVEEKKWARVFEELVERFADTVSRSEFEEIALKLGFDVDREDQAFVHVLVDALELPLERWQRIHDPDGRLFYFCPSMTTQLFASAAVSKGPKITASAVWKRPGMAHFARLHAKLRHEREVQAREKRAQERTAQSLEANLNRMKKSRQNAPPASSMPVRSWDVGHRLLGKGSELSEAAKANFQKHRDQHEHKAAEVVAKLPPQLLYYREDLRDAAAREMEEGAFAGHFVRALEALPPEAGNHADQGDVLPPHASDQSLSKMTFDEMRGWGVEGGSDGGDGSESRGAEGGVSAAAGGRDHYGPGQDESSHDLVLEEAEVQNEGRWQHEETVPLPTLPRMPAMGNVRPMPLQADSEPQKSAASAATAKNLNKMETLDCGPVSPSRWMMGDGARINLAPARFPLVLTSTTLSNAERHVHEILQSPSPRNRANLLEPVTRSKAVDTNLEQDIDALKKTLFPRGGFEVGGW